MFDLRKSRSLRRSVGGQGPRPCANPLPPARLATNAVANRRALGHGVTFGVSFGKPVGIVVALSGADPNPNTTAPVTVDASAVPVAAARIAVTRAYAQLGRFENERESFPGQC